MTFRVFAEPRKGVVVHTAASRVLRESRMHDWLGATCEETWPAALRVGLLDQYLFFSVRRGADDWADSGCYGEMAGE